MRSWRTLMTSPAPALERAMHNITSVVKTASDENWLVINSFVLLLVLAAITTDPIFTIIGHFVACRAWCPKFTSIARCSWQFTFEFRVCNSILWPHLAVLGVLSWIPGDIVRVYNRWWWQVLTCSTSEGYSCQSHLHNQRHIFNV